MQPLERRHNADSIYEMMLIFQTDVDFVELGRWMLVIFNNIRWNLAGPLLPLLSTLHKVEWFSYLDR